MRIRLPQSRLPIRPAAFTSRTFTTTPVVSQPPPPPHQRQQPFPTTPTCPPSTCHCNPTPSLGPGLEIDLKTPLNGAITAYQEQILICTGRDDWASRIEEEDGGDNLAGYLKNKFFGRGGEFVDPFWNVSVLNASFESTPASPSSQAVGEEKKDGLSKSQGSGATRSIYLLPSFKYIPHVREREYEDVKALVKGWVLPTKLSKMYEKTPEMMPEDPGKLLRDESFRSRLAGVRDVDEVLVLICGHGGRDERCGVYGPLLRGEFEEKLSTVGGLTVQTGAKKINTSPDPAESQPATSARVGLISHIGGHKYAGNVILYIPPGMKTEAGEEHPLAGMGIWYGRVEPRQVEGIIRETLLGGKVIEEFYRGAIDKERRILRLELGEGIKRVKRSK